MPSADDRSNHVPASPLGFDTTHWSLVLEAGRAQTSQSAAALAALCQTYWYPLYAFVRRRVADSAEAQDLTQSFFAELLEKKVVSVATPARGRFRAFLLTALKHFLGKQWDAAKALKRGGGRAALSLDFATADSRYASEPAAGLTAEQIFARQWAVTLLEQVMRRLEQEFVDRNQGDAFRALRGFAIGEHAGGGYAEAAAVLGITPDAAKMAAHRMRGRYRQLLREEIAHTVATPAEVDDEIRSLFHVLSL